MKNRLIQIFCIILLFSFNPNIVYGSFKEIWKGNFNKKIEKLFVRDLNKNGVKEILILCEYKNLKLLEWKKNAFIVRWQSPEFVRAVDFEYFEFNNFLFIKKYDPQYGPIIPQTLLYKKGLYLLEDIKESLIPFWKDEEYVTTESFKKRGANDVIITFSKVGNLRDVYLIIREAISPNRLLWMSDFKIDKQVGVQIFGDFDGDKKIELLLITGGTKNYWINREGDEFRNKLIKRYIKDKAEPLFLLNPINQKFLKAGRTVSKDFDELFFIDALYYGGPIYKATWKKDKFDVQGIVSPQYFEKKKGETGFENLNLADIDNDGLDEIIISGVRGDLVETEEEPFIKNRRDVIHILKWDGKKYKKIWTSKSLGLITQIIVDDVTGDGKKEIIVGNDKGKIHIFGQN